MHTVERRVIAGITAQSPELTDVVDVRHRPLLVEARPQGINDWIDQIGQRRVERRPWQRLPNTDLSRTVTRRGCGRDSQEDSSGGGCWPSHVAGSAVGRLPEYSSIW